MIQVERLSDGTRRLVSVCEVTGMEGDVITLQDLFTFTQSTVDQRGRVRGRFATTGVRPAFSEKLNRCGIKLPASLQGFYEDV